MQRDHKDRQQWAYACPPTRGQRVTAMSFLSHAPREALHGQGRHRQHKVTWLSRPFLENSVSKRQPAEGSRSLRREDRCDHQLRPCCQPPVSMKQVGHRGPWKERRMSPAAGRDGCALPPWPRAAWTGGVEDSVTDSKDTRRQRSARQESRWQRDPHFTSKHVILPEGRHGLAFCALL